MFGLLILFMFLVLLVFLMLFILLLLLLLEGSDFSLVLLRVFGCDQINLEVLLDEVLESNSTHSDSGEA